MKQLTEYEHLCVAFRSLKSRLINKHYRLHGLRIDERNLLLTAFIADCPEWRPEIYRDAVVIHAQDKIESLYNEITAKIEDWLAATRNLLTAKFSVVEREITVLLGQFVADTCGYVAALNLGHLGGVINQINVAYMSNILDMQTSKERLKC